MPADRRSIFERPVVAALVALLIERILLPFEIAGLFVRTISWNIIGGLGKKPRGLLVVAFSHREIALYGGRTRRAEHMLVPCLVRLLLSFFRRLRRGNLGLCRLPQ